MYQEYLDTIQRMYIDIEGEWLKCQDSVHTAKTSREYTSLSLILIDLRRIQIHIRSLLLSRDN